MVKKVIAFAGVFVLIAASAFGIVALKNKAGKKGEDNSSGLADQNAVSESISEADTAEKKEETDPESIRYILAPDTTITMMGYAADSEYIILMKGLEAVIGTYPDHSTAVIDANEDHYLRWFPYNDDVAVGVTKTDGSYGYYCMGDEGWYEDPDAGPTSLLLDDEEGIGAFGENTVTVMVSDLQEQGNSIYKIGTEIRNKCIDNLGDEAEYAVAVLSFDFYYNGTSYVMDPQNPSESISANLDGTTDKKPLYVIIAGQKDGVYDYIDKITDYLDHNGILYDQVDNLKAHADPEVGLQVTESAFADKEEITKIIHSKSTDRENQLSDYVQTHITRLKRCSQENAEKVSDAGIAESALVYEAARMNINTEYKDVWNWTATYSEEQVNQYESLPYSTFCNCITVSQERDGNWQEIPQSEWSKLYEISAENGVMRINCKGEKAGIKTEKGNLKVVFHMQQSIDKEVSYPEWISEKDLVLSGTEQSNDPKLWNQKTLDLDLFCRSLLAMNTTDTVIHCGIDQTEDLEAVFLDVTVIKK